MPITRILCLSALGALVACSKKPQFPDALLFSGKCSVTIESAMHEAHITLDGIMIGHGKVSANLPCGEKQILVEKHGYIPYIEYKVIREGEALRVKVPELKKYKEAEDYALSPTLVEQVRNGQPLRNPFVAEGVLVASADGGAHSEASLIAHSAPLAAQASAKGAPVAASGAGAPTSPAAASATASGCTQWCSADDWR